MLNGKVVGLIALLRGEAEARQVKPRLLIRETGLKAKLVVLLRVLLVGELRLKPELVVRESRLLVGKLTLEVEPVALKPCGLIGEICL